MHAGVIFYDFDKEKLDEVESKWKRSVLGQARHQQGFKGVLFCIDRDTGHGFDVGFWETEEDAKRFEEAGLYGLVMEEIRDLMTTEPRRRTYSVIVKD